MKKKNRKLKRNGEGKKNKSRREGYEKEKEDLKR